MRAPREQLPILIRDYDRARDREYIRALAVETADAGRHAQNIWHFTDVVADVLTGYYIDFEPESIRVAEVDGKFAGYVLGSVKPRRHRLLSALSVIPKAVFKAIKAGALWRKDSWLLLRTLSKSLGFSASVRKQISEYYPAHLHINVHPKFRGRGVGSWLIRTFESYVRSSGLKGVHARVRGDNEQGRRFFERAGYTLLQESKPITIWYRDGRLKQTRLAIYGKRL